MNSPTHTLLALALLSKRGDRKRNWAVALGSIIPDVAIYLWAPYQRFVNGVSGEKLWRELYFAEPMQNLIAYFNSIPIYGALAILGYVMRAKTWGKLMLFFALAALTHMATDLPVHNHDAYRHFWPLSDWRFISPLSYYESEHHAGWVMVVELAIWVTSSIVLWKRFPHRWVKAVIIGLPLSLISIALLFLFGILSFSG